MNRDALADGIMIACRKYLGDDVAISNLKPLTAGASAATWQFELAQANRHRPLILQLFAGGDRFFGALDKRTQAMLQGQAHRAGIPTPKVLFVLDEGDGLGDGFAMEYVAGETLGHRIVRDERFAAARASMAAQCGAILAGIHALDVAEFAGLPSAAPLEMVEQLYESHRSFGEDLPVFELAFRFLSDCVPELDKRTLVHGDFRNGNIVVDESGIVAVLDWELAHVGDLHEDLAWLCVNAWRFGNIDMPVGGFGDRQDLYDAYDRATGDRVDTERVRYWQVFGTLKWGVICQWFGDRFVSGDVREFERAVIGRRTSETELDLLDLLERVE